MCVTGASILSIVISKLRHWWKPGLVIVLKVDESSKVSLYCTVLSFCLPVCLKMGRDRELSLNVKEIPGQEPELRYKNRFVVIDDRVWEIVISHHYVDNYFRQF